MSNEQKSNSPKLPINPEALASFLVGLEEAGLIHINRKKLKL
jgi:hypothetical protein